MPLVEDGAWAAHPVATHLAFDSAGIEASAAADTLPATDFVQKLAAPGRQALRGERPQLAAFCV